MTGNMHRYFLATLLGAGLCSALPQDNGESQLTAHPETVHGLGDGLNFEFTESDSPIPFTINVDPDFISATRLKSALYRPTRNIEGVGWAGGPPVSDIAKLQQYFLEKYSWEDVQSQLNEKYRNIMFTTSVSGGPNYTDPIQLRFAHQKSDREDAIPLLMVHGFPSSFLEFEDVIQPLAKPPNDSLPAFHVVTPDLPGFAFSPQPKANGE
jgi:pimeloyl-ACP methyl ester carboxylesterase